MVILAVRTTHATSLMDNLRVVEEIRVVNMGVISLTFRIVKSQIYRGEYYADKWPQFLNGRLSGYSPPPQSTANLAEAFQATCNVLDTNSGPDRYVDSGATAHMTSQTSALDSFEPYSSNGSVIIGNGNALSISHIGSSKHTFDVNLLDVLVIPHITKNLLSISKLMSDYNVDVVFF